MLVAAGLPGARVNGQSDCDGLRPLSIGREAGKKKKKSTIIVVP